jgi:hypothetical protein
MYNDDAKQYIYKWRENHRDEWNSYHNMKEKERYAKHKDTIKEKYEYRTWLFNTNIKKEFKIFSNIEY